MSAARESPGPLRRELGALSAILVTVGSMVGSGIFATPHDVARSVSSPVATLALWIVGGFLALLGAFVFAELGAAMPDTGGLYVYLRRAFGPFAAFAFAFAMLFVLVPSGAGYFASVAAQHIVDVAHLDASLETPIAIAVIVVVTTANLLGVRSGAGVQNLATAVKYGGVLLIAGLGVSARARPIVHAAVAHGGAIGAIAALVPVLWAYDGFVDLTSMGGEMRHPSRDIPRALVLGTVLVIALYLFANAGYLVALGTSGLAATEAPANDLAAHALGASGRIVAATIVAISTFGGCAVSLLTGSRVVFALAQTGGLFRGLAHTSRTGVPDRAIALLGALSLAYLSSRIGALGAVFVVGAWPFYALGAVAVIVLRRRQPDLARPFRTPGYPYSVLAFAVVSVGIVAVYAVSDPLRTFVSLGIIALAGPVYLVARTRSNPS